MFTTHGQLPSVTFKMFRLLSFLLFTEADTKEKVERGSQ
jgi:hypothetical protein